MNEDKRKVMLIDDNIISLMVTAEVLSTHGYTVSKTASAQGCIAKIEYEEPDVVLIDPAMPRLPMDRLLDTIRNGDMEKDVSVVLFSDQPAKALIEASQAKNMNGYFSKSIEVTRLPEYMENFF